MSGSPRPPENVDYIMSTKDRIRITNRNLLYALFAFCSFLLILIVYVVTTTHNQIKNSQPSHFGTFRTDRKEDIAVMFTTFSEPQAEWPDITDVQRNTLTYMSLMPNVVAVLFTDSDYWLNECKHMKVLCYSDFPKNPYGLPFLFGMFQTAIKNVPGRPFYCYINGDILIQRTLTPTLQDLQRKIEQGTLSPKVAMFTQRRNFYVDLSVDMYTDTGIDELFETQKRKARTYWDAAIDLFVFTPSTFNWDFMPRFVIGRAKFDNWIIQYVSRSEEIAMIDATQAVMLLHQTGKRGNRSGVKKERAGGAGPDPGSNLVWNDIIAGAIEKGCCEEMWFSEQAHYTLIPTNHGLCLEKKGSLTYFEDDYQEDEKRVFAAFTTHPSNCLVLGEGTVDGVENLYCDTITYLFYRPDQCADSRVRLSTCFSNKEYKVICSAARPDLYPEQYLAPLKYTKESYTHVFVLLKKAPGLLNYLRRYISPNRLNVPGSHAGDMGVIYMRRWNHKETSYGMTHGTDFSILHLLPPPTPMEGPHFPYLGLAVLTFN
ncbi:hypothetical protein WA158_004879 [Blastocystis sp. Blastoise]